MCERTAALPSPAPLTHITCYTGNIGSGTWPEITPDSREQDRTFSARDLCIKNV